MVSPARIDGKNRVFRWLDANRVFRGAGMALAVRVGTSRRLRFAVKMGDIRP
jgi:hypothetical protein